MPPRLAVVAMVPIATAPLLLPCTAAPVDRASASPAPEAPGYTGRTLNAPPDIAGLPELGTHGLRVAEETVGVVVKVEHG